MKILSVRIYFAALCAMIFSTLPISAAQFSISPDGTSYLTGTLPDNIYARYGEVRLEVRNAITTPLVQCWAPPSPGTPSCLGFPSEAYNATLTVLMDVSIFDALGTLVTSFTNSWGMESCPGNCHGYLIDISPGPNPTIGFLFPVNPGRIETSLRIFNTPNILSFDILASLVVPVGIELSPTPVPASLPLFATGVGLLALIRHRRRKIAGRRA